MCCVQGEYAQHLQYAHELYQALSAAAVDWLVHTVGVHWLPREDLQRALNAMLINSLDASDGEDDCEVSQHSLETGLPAN